MTLASAFGRFGLRTREQSQQSQEEGRQEEKKSGMDRWHLVSAQIMGW